MRYSALALVLAFATAAPAGEPQGFALARSLEERGYLFSAFFQYAAIVQAGPSGPDHLKAIEGAAATAEKLRDDVVAPHLFDRIPSASIAALPPQRQARIHAALALLAYRAGRYEDAARLVERVPADSASAPQAMYLRGLLQQRTAPEQAAQTFAALARQDRAPRELREMASLALGRTLYGLHRYAEASAAYQTLPRFSRHWDESLFEGAYADLQNGDPGGALGKLHSLHSPHLRDEFVPESVALTAILYLQRCLYPQVRTALGEFDGEYLPMRDRIKQLLAANLPLEDYGRMLGPDDTRLPAPAQHHLLKNERVSAMRDYLAQLERESARLRGDGSFAAALKQDLLEALAEQQAQSQRLLGKFVQGRLLDMVRLIDVLEGDRELIAFEATKGEKEMLETRYDPSAQLAAQQLRRPAMPQTGHEYWPFDGEYWPDEIGYYRYTVKDACPRSKDE